MVSGYERATNEIIPAIRSALVKELSNRYKVSQEKISDYLGITQAAVSKYINDKYSQKIKEIEGMIDRNLIESYAKKIVDGDVKAANICICTICNVFNAFGCQFSYAQK